LLVVDDDQALREFVAVILRLAGYTVLAASDGAGVPEMVIAEKPRLVIMDVTMPRVSGLEALRRLRAIGSDVPVIMLTAHGDEDDKLAAFDAGADDYLVKPFNARELVARVGAVLRRARLAATETGAGTIVSIGPLTLVPDGYSASIEDRDVRLTRLEYALLLTLARSAGRVFTPGDLLTHIWGPEYRDQAEILRTNIYRLRQKLEADPRQPRYLKTQPGVGYYFSPDEPGWPKVPGRTDFKPDCYTFVTYFPRRRYSAVTGKKP
jgi:DNA-binding response OmpR family regulator